MQECKLYRNLLFPFFIILEQTTMNKQFKFLKKEKRNKKTKNFHSFLK
ncbi:hypothetical protein HMPREF0204_15260 [Chryseobacterium gleum ATCC 35910]|uniref:Uncharacterized protein n=1 Tax=Chryseobacterium gleum ATCC 35910 TaxID=525257 RepID=A0ABN0ASZ0_CHRGE|nr:hypothetical protein HMPREF0204_15260 [Chryseobacterium gleum ATCC 35910]